MNIGVDLCTSADASSRARDSGLGVTIRGEASRSFKSDVGVSWELVADARSAWCRRAGMLRFVERCLVSAYDGACPG